VLGHIDGLVKEEERLYAKGELTDDDRDRLAKIKSRTGPVLDLLRQASSLGESLGVTRIRQRCGPPKVVENYEQ